MCRVLRIVGAESLRIKRGEWGTQHSGANGPSNWPQRDFCARARQLTPQAATETSIVPGTPHGLITTFTAAVALAFAAPAAAGTNGGVALSSPSPVVASVTCTQAAAVCARGEQLHVTGTALDATSLVAFMGAKGSRDDRRARPQATGDGELTVTVPSKAVSGPVTLITTEGDRVRAAAKVTIRARAAAAAPAPAPLVAPVGSTLAVATGDIFPIRAAHDLGQGPINNFGGARGHKGQDLFAACGAPIVAARGGIATKVAFEARAGNYAVITTADGQSHVYMHMRAAALIRQGDSVATGQAIGEVGETGVASGCHLHFELWTAPGWYAGGKAIDPLPTLKAWDDQS